MFKCLLADASVFMSDHLFKARKKLEAIFLNYSGYRSFRRGTEIVIYELMMNLYVFLVFAQFGTQPIIICNLYKIISVF